MKNIIHSFKQKCDVKAQPKLNVWKTFISHPERHANIIYVRFLLKYSQHRYSNWCGVGNESDITRPEAETNALMDLLYTVYLLISSSIFFFF